MKAYKYRGGVGIFDKDKESIFHRDIDTIVKNQIYLPHKSQLNDPTEGFIDDDALFTFLASFKDYADNLKESYNELRKTINQCLGLMKRNID